MEAKHAAIGDAVWERLADLGSRLLKQMPVAQAPLACMRLSSSAVVDRLGARILSSDGTKVTC